MRCAGNQLYWIFACMSVSISEKKKHVARFPGMKVISIFMLLSYDGA